MAERYDMVTTVLRILVVLYMVQALAKFAVHFLVPYEKRIEKIGDYYNKDASTIRRYDDITLALMIVFVVLLIVSGKLDALNFATALVVGMTLIQLYFHRFIDELPPDKAPAPPLRPVKLISFAIQAHPQKAWREYALMTVLLGGMIVALVAQV
jgi:hypothetical protein